jgi:predicted metallo-beta-lactamase superfamily hydrolase
VLPQLISDLFQTANGLLLWQYHYDNTTHKYTSPIHNTHTTYTQIYISHKISPLKINKQTKQRKTNQLTNSEGHIAATNRVKKEKK